MTLKLSDSKFLTSAAKLSQCPADTGLEVAFCGRSNAGKSSAINFLTDNSKLAKTSKTPGRTQLLNFFTVTDQFRLVDLPGYGYAKVPERVRNSWHQNIDSYLRNRESLCGLVLVMDIRHPLRPFDDMMLNWSEEAQLPIHILLTKSDKLKKGPASATLEKVRSLLGENELVSVQLFSSSKKVGREQFIQKLEQWRKELEAEE